MQTQRVENERVETHVNKLKGANNKCRLANEG